MRTSIIIVLALLIFTGCPQQQPAPAASTSSAVVTKARPMPGRPMAVPAKADLVTTKFKVEGMDCKDCSKAIEAKLIGTSGISTVAADGKAGQVSVQYDAAKVSKTDIIALIDSLKFRASVME